MIIKNGLVFCLLLGLVGCATMPRRYANYIPPVQQELPQRNAFAIPLPGCYVISPFGVRGHGFHTGIDLKKSQQGGDAIVAARSGIVEAVQRSRGYGLMITLWHLDCSRTQYAHLRKALVKPGQTVEYGDEIAEVGSSGRASTPHLHFEILTRNGQPVDPYPFLSQSGTILIGR
jgi:murein DD-endopeptidase MepM/ murein hydrolase activator NlpD